MAKKKEAAMTEKEIMKRPTKQSFAKITKNKKKNRRTWVVIYRLVDGPAIDLDKVEKSRRARKKWAAKKK